jgi:gentisate 1,2-dioxygenase
VTKIGRSKSDEADLVWNERDCFNVPAWLWHRFKNSSQGESAILFSVSDRPVFEALKLYREQA